MRRRHPTVRVPGAALHDRLPGDVGHRGAERRGQRHRAGLDETRVAVGQGPPRRRHERCGARRGRAAADRLRRLRTHAVPHDHGGPTGDPGRVRLRAPGLIGSTVPGPGDPFPFLSPGSGLPPSRGPPRMMPKVTVLPPPFTPPRYGLQSVVIPRADGRADLGGVEWLSETCGNIDHTYWAD